MWGDRSQYLLIAGRAIACLSLACALALLSVDRADADVEVTCPAAAAYEDFITFDATTPPESCAIGYPSALIGGGSGFHLVNQFQGYNQIQYGYWKAGAETGMTPTCAGAGCGTMGPGLATCSAPTGGGSCAFSFSYVDHNDDTVSFSFTVADGTTIIPGFTVLIDKPQPSLTVTKQVDKATTSTAGDVLTYTITVTNSGEVDLTNVVVTDEMTGGAVFESGDDGDEVLKVDEIWIYSAQYTVTSDDIEAGADIVNTVSVATDETDPVEAHATTTITDIVVDLVAVAERTGRVISNFMFRRADMIAGSDPGLSGRLLDRDGGGGRPPLGFSASDAGFNVGFAASLAALAADRAPRTGAGSGPALAYDGEIGRIEGGRYAAPEAGSIAPQDGLDVWMDGRWAHAHGHGQESDFALLRIGADFLVNPSLLAGVLASLDWTDFRDAAEGVAADGIGWMAGPYIVARLSQSLMLDAHVGWGQSANHVNPLGDYVDAFGADRFLARVRVSGDFVSGGWRFTPHVGAVYFEELQKAYTDSNDVTIAERTVSLGRLTFGPTISYVFVGRDVEIEPHFGVSGSWDFLGTGMVDLDSGLPAGSSATVRGRIEGGVRLRSAGGLSLAGEAFYEGFVPDDSESYGGSVKVTVPLN